MAKKPYFAPVFVVASGGIDITDSQEGSVGTGETYGDILKTLYSMGFTDADITGAGLDINDIANWGNIVPGFNPNDDSTWTLVVDHIFPTWE